MKQSLQDALDKVELNYHDLVDIANEATADQFDKANTLVDSITKNINKLTPDQIRDSMLQLQLEAYRLSEIKEKSQLKADLAEALMKEKYAMTFNSLEGAAAVKDKLSQVQIADEVVSETFYNLIAALFKTKVDQLHRLVSVLNSILMSRMQEAKYMNQGIADDPGSYKTKKELLLEGE